MTEKAQEKREAELRIAAEIKKKFGAQIDLNKTPLVIIEIIRNFRHLFNDDEVADGTGGVSPSTIAGSPPSHDEVIDNATLLHEILNLQKTMKEIQKSLNSKTWRS